MPAKPKTKNHSGFLMNTTIHAILNCQCYPLCDVLYNVGKSTARLQKATVNQAIDIEHKTFVQCWSPVVQYPTHLIWKQCVSELSKCNIPDETINPQKLRDTKHMLILELVKVLDS